MEPYVALPIGDSLYEDDSIAYNKKGKKFFLIGHKTTQN